MRNTARFFYRKGKIRGTCCFLGGIALVLCGWPVIGIAVELFGMINLFGYGSWMTRVVACTGRVAPC